MYNLHLQWLDDEHIKPHRINITKKHKKWNREPQQMEETMEEQMKTELHQQTLGKETELANLRLQLQNVQACNLAEGLSFQSGLRVETNCQTCSYTQLRMNGLPGGYSQILINGRPVFSPLAGLYGMEQIPTNMIDRIEIVRGGGSSLYGSSAVGGVVNVITKLPKKNDYFKKNYRICNEN